MKEIIGAIFVFIPILAICIFFIIEYINAWSEGEYRIAIVMTLFFMLLIGGILIN